MTYKPIFRNMYIFWLFLDDIVFIYMTLWLVKYLGIGNYIIIKLVICSICVCAGINNAKKIRESLKLKNAFFFAYFIGVALGTLTLPMYNPTQAGICLIVCGVYMNVKMKEFNLDEYASQYDEIGSMSYRISKLLKDILLYLFTPCCVIMGLITIGFGIKEIIEIIF